MRYNLAMGIITDLKNTISQVVDELYNIKIKSSDIIIEIPKDSSHGDLSSNIAMQIVREAKENPRVIGEKITTKLKELLNEKVDSIDIAGAGFINFKINDKAFERIESEFEYKFKDKKVIVEWTDPNPFKEFHIGHLYSNIVGESISRLIKSQGAQIKRVTYQGDVGMHVAKSIWGIINLLKQDNLKIENIESKPIRERVNFLGKAYAFGAKEFKDNEKATEEIKEINLLIYLSAQKRLIEEENWEPQVDYKSLIKTSNFDIQNIEKIFRLGRKWSLDYFDMMYSRMGSHFDKNYFESEVGEVGLKIIKEYLPKGVFKESDGAIVFQGEDYGLHTRVFVNSLGLPTYEAKELGLAPTKYRDFKYDISIILTGNEINDYFKVLLKVMSIVNPELAEKTIHMSHGMVKLPEGKMSSRTGNIITGEWLVEEALSQIKTKSDTLTDEEFEKIAVASVKYALLKHSIGDDIVFSIKESISFEGNSGPYLLYSYTRANSVINKYGKELQKENIIQLDEDEKNILIKLSMFGETVSKATELFSPHILCGYLYDLSQLFNKFYNSHSILNSGDEHITLQRVYICNEFCKTLKSGLELLGIETVERM